MSLYNIGISGSAAFELMRPHSSAHDFDIDFYVAPNLHCIAGAITSLETSLSRWRRELLQESSDTPSAAVTDFLTRLKSLDDEFGGIGFEKEIITVPVGRGAVVLANRIDSGCDFLTWMRVLRGRCESLEKIVQLIFAPNYSLLAHICRFHSSLAQVLLTLTDAVHLYEELISTNTAYS
ncbi:unnamed protein product [Zymoseptoria tritici ST99CH_3D1]|nr:unnamed protein product [Zymoseptoria tritici ST99CH_3D1]